MPLCGALRLARDRTDVLLKRGPLRSRSLKSAKILLGRPRDGVNRALQAKSAGIPVERRFCLGENQHEFPMNFLRPYARVLRLFGAEGPPPRLLAVPNAAPAAAHIVQPGLVGGLNAALV